MDYVSPRLSEHYTGALRAGEIVIVAGANQGRKYRRRVSAGLGTAEAPFSETQSIEAAFAAAALAGRSALRFWLWGYGRTLKEGCAYWYRARGGATGIIVPIGRSKVSTDHTLRYTRSALARDAGALEQESKAALPTGAACVYIGCSWGAAIIDYGFDPSHPCLTRSAGIAIAGPTHVLDFALRRSFLRHRLRPDGDYGDCWVRRHPTDPIGSGGLSPLLYWLRPSAHNYMRPCSSSARPWFWGISGNEAEDGPGDLA